MNNRQEIRWAPFESVLNTTTILNELKEENQKKEKPLLSSDELDELERKILNAYHTKMKIKVTYYYQGFCYEKVGIITHISKETSKIFFLDYTSLYFEQILKVSSLFV